jgi:hypothetical protein
MSGFLQRLAERATGAVHSLRTVSSTLFAPSLIEPSLIEPSPIEGLQPPLGAMTAAKVDVGPSIIGQAAMIGQAAASPAQPAQHGVPGGGATSAHRHAAARIGFGEGADQTVTARRPAASETAADTSAGPPASQKPQRIIPPASSRLLDPAAETGIGSESPSPAHQGTQTDYRVELYPVQAAIARIEPLLPPTQPVRTPLAPTASASIDNQGRLPAGTIEETTEVHIRIGRIEVTAVHEPAPAKPVAARRNAPMSLDDYLAKRHGGRT